MKDGTLNIIKSILDNDDSVTQENKSAILAFCKNPTARTAPAISQPVKYLTPNQVADKLGVCLRSVQRWISTGQLPSKKLGECRRVPSNALDDLSALSPSNAAAKREYRRISTTTLHLKHLKQDELEKVS